MRWLLLCLVLVLSGCKESARDPAQDERDIAHVERAQDLHPPVIKLTPQPIAFTDFEQDNFYGAGCAFTPKAAEGLGPVLYTIADRGLVKLDDAALVLAADSGSAEFPYGTRDTYTGQEHTFVLTKGGGDGALTGEESVRWPGSLTIRDRWNRVAYQASGSLECGA